MPRVVEYKPSDKAALEELEKIKRSLGIVGAISNKEEYRKARAYFERIGWNMSMLSCNPDVYGGADPVKKARCMLYNEMRSWEVSQQVRGNEEQLRRYGEAYRGVYEHNKRIFEVQRKAIESDISGSKMKEIEEFAKGKPVKPKEPPLIAPVKAPTSVKSPEPVFKALSTPTESGDRYKLIIAGGLVLLGVGWWILSKEG